MNKNRIYNELSAKTCITIITSVATNGVPYVNIKTLFEHMKNSSFKVLYGIIGANVATIGMEIIKQQ